MIDFFGIKSRKLLAHQSKLMAALSKEIEHRRLCGVNNQALIIGQGDEIARLMRDVGALRELASVLRQRINTHGKTTAEGEFIAICEDIHANGKMLSLRRFNAAMDLIKKQRKSMVAEWES